MHPDRDFEAEAKLPRQEPALTQDLELETLVHAMAGQDDTIRRVAYTALSNAVSNDFETIAHRQAVLKDCIANPAAVRELYDLAGEALAAQKKHYFGISARYPSILLHTARDLLQAHVAVLREVRRVADAGAGSFGSKGFSTLIEMLRRDLTDEYLAEIEHHLAYVRYSEALLTSAELGEGNEGSNYVLRLPSRSTPSWVDRLLRKRPEAYTFRLDPRDEAGARTLSELRDQAQNRVANALAQSADHVSGFFETLRNELAFYLGCVRLHDALGAMGARVCFPIPSPVGSGTNSVRGLYDPCLALTLRRAVVGNTVDVGPKRLVVITGANQGGKSTFLRSIGVAQLMMQAGMFVAAEELSAEPCRGLFTHYRREEAPITKRGKLDEELARMSDIADGLVPHAMVLFNESFASTNEREGSEIATQIARALVERRVRVFFVTHQYDFAHRFVGSPDALFLRAERLPDGTRTFRLVEGEPQKTSYGQDLYREVFGPS